MDIRLKRAYDPPARNDGLRVLVDRVWPRGVSKEDLRADLWLKEAAPGAGLRKWFGHDPAKWDEFRRRHHAELYSNKSALEPIVKKLREGGRVTLVFAARDTERNNAVSLKDYLLELDELKPS